MIFKQRLFSGLLDKVIVNLVMDRQNSDGKEARRVIMSVSHKPYDG